MPRKNKQNLSAIGVGLTAKQMKRRKPINSEAMRDIEPLTENQKKLFESYDEGKNLIAYGVAGTGKTFISPIMHCVMFLIQIHLMRKYTSSGLLWPPER